MLQSLILIITHISQFTAVVDARFEGVHGLAVCALIGLEYASAMWTCQAIHDCRAWPFERSPIVLRLY